MLHTPWAKSQIEKLVENQLSNDTQIAEVNGLGGFIPLGMTLASFQLADKDGVWLDVENAKFDVSIRNLFIGAARIQEVGAGRVVLSRIPASNEPPPPPSNEPFAIPELPELPESLPDLAIRRLFVDELVLGKPVIGQELSLKLDGEIRTIDDGSAVKASIDIDGLAPSTLLGDLNARLVLADPALDWTLDLVETDGLISKLAQMPELGDVSLNWQGQGPLSDWQSTLDFKAGGVAHANLDLGIGLLEQPKLSLKGHVEPDGNLLPPEIANLLAEPIDLEIALQQLEPGHFRLSALELESLLADMSGQAVINQPAGDLDADILLRVQDLGHLSQLAGMELAGGVEIGLVGENASPGPKLTLLLQGDGIQADANVIDAINGKFDFAFTTPLEDGFAGTLAQGGISMDGINLDGKPLLPGETISLELDADLQLEGQSLLHALQLNAGPAQVRAQGDAVISEGAGKAVLNANIASLQALLEALEVDLPGLDGSTELKVDVNFADQFKTFVSDLHLSTTNLEGLPANAGSLVGGGPTIAAHAEAELGKEAQISGLLIKLDSAELTGELTAGLDDAAQLSGQIRAAIPALAALEPVIQQALGGSANLSVDISGTQQAPNLELAADILDLAVAGQAIDKIALRVTGSELVDAPQGQLNLDVIQSQGTLSLQTGYLLNGDQLELSDFALDGPATRLAGAVQADLANTLINGELKGGVSDLAALAPWHNQNLTGSVDLDILLDTAAGTQNIQAIAGIPSLAGDFGDVSGLALDAQITDAMNDAQMAVSLDLASFSQPDLVVRNTSLSANGTLSALDIELATSGTQGKDPFSVNLAASADIAGEAKKVVLSRLNGRAAGQDITLVRPRHHHPARR